MYGDNDHPAKRPHLQQAGVMQDIGNAATPPHVPQPNGGASDSTQSTLPEENDKIFPFPGNRFRCYWGDCVAVFTEDEQEGPNKKAQLRTRLQEHFDEHFTENGGRLSDIEKCCWAHRRDYKIDPGNQAGTSDPPQRCDELLKKGKRTMQRHVVAHQPRDQRLSRCRYNCGQSFTRSDTFKRHEKGCENRTTSAGT